MAEQPSLKDLARRVLDRNTASNKTGTWVEHKAEQKTRQRNTEKPPFESIESALAIACEDQPISANEVMGHLSEDDKADWESGELTHSQLRDYIGAVVERRMRDAGQVPPHYTAITHCRGCGPVWIFEGCPPEVWGCPWCWNRVKGRPVPRADSINQSNEAR